MNNNEPYQASTWRIGGGSAPKMLIAIYNYFLFVSVFSALEVKPQKSSANLFISRYETIYEWVEQSLQKLRKALLNSSYFHFRSAVYIGWWSKKYLNLNFLAHTNRPHQCKSMYVSLGTKQFYS